MKLVVGLGNPGREYAGTRHNVGFDLIDALAARLGFIGNASEFDRFAKAKFESFSMDGPVTLGGASDKVLLLKPMTFMNLSGGAVQAALAFYQLPLRDLLVVLDDMALPCGKIRLRAAGSSGGHNGLKDIERALSGTTYSRLRIGIDAPPTRVPSRDYVLGRFSEEQRKALSPAITRGVDAALVWMEKGIETAMNRFNPDAES